MEFEDGALEGKAETFVDFKSFKAVEAEGDPSGGFEGYGAVYGNRDLGGDIMLPGSVKNVDQLVREGFIGLNHDWDRLPIGIVTDARQDQHGLWIKTAYHSHPEAQAARAVALERLAADKTVGLSIGYTVHPGGWQMVGEATRHLSAVDVHEISQVNAPMNPSAGVTDAKKMAIPSHTTAKADEGEVWDGPAEVAAAPGEESVLRRMHAWRATDGDPDVKSSYKLPHHKADGGAVVWRGVAGAMGALMGGRGGVDIPDGDRRGVYSHLAAHYRQFDREPPEFRGWPSREDLEKYAAGAVFDLAVYADRLAGYSEARVKEGRILSGANRQRLSTLLVALDDVRGDIEKLLRETDPEKGRAEARAIIAEGLVLAAQAEGLLRNGHVR